MDKKLLLLGTIILMMIPLASSWTNNYLFLQPSELCYQETANVATSCGGLSTGTYSHNTAWNDGNWSTGESMGVSTRTVTYTKPIGATQNSLWQVSSGNSPILLINVSIPNNCWDYSSTNLQLRFSRTFGDSGWECYDGAVWTRLATSINGYNTALEEAMIWDISYKTSELINYSSRFNFFGANFENIIESPLISVSITPTKNSWSSNGLYSANYTLSDSRMYIHDINLTKLNTLELDINRSGNPTYFRIAVAPNGSTSSFDTNCEIGNYTADGTAHLKFNMSICNDGTLRTLWIYNFRFLSGYYTYTYIDNLKIYNSQSNLNRYFVIPSNYSIVTNAKVTLTSISNNLTYIFNDSTMLSSAICQGGTNCDQTVFGGNRTDNNFNTASRNYGGSGGGLNYTVFENYTIRNQKWNDVVYHVKIGVGCDEVNTITSNYTISIFNSTLGSYIALTSGTIISVADIKELYLPFNQDFISSDIVKFKTSMTRGGACNLPSLNFYEGEVINTDYIYPQNVTVNIAGLNNILSTSLFTTQTTPNNFAQYLNTYRSLYCTPSTNCSVPLNFAFLDGNIRYDNILLSNDGFVENNNLFNAITYEGITETFQLNTTIDTNSFSLYNATITYNGTETMVNWNIQGSNVLLSTNLFIPNVDSIVSNSFYWTIVLTNGTSLSYHYSTVQNQLVLPLEIGNCTQYDDRIFTIGSLVDEDTRILVNSSDNPLINIYLKVGNQPDNQAYTEYNLITNSFSNINICMPSALTNITNFRIDGILSYETDNHVKEFWYIDNGTIRNNNDSLDSFTTNNITLYDLSLMNSKSFKFTFYDENYNTLQGGIVHVLRKYIGSGEILEVERGKLDPNGETILHLVEEDEIYQFRITLNGQQIYLSDEYNAKCIETPCTITLQKGGEITTIDGTYDNLAEGTYSLTSDKTTRDVTLSYNLESTGTMTLDVYQYTSSANDPLVGSSSQTATSGTIIVNVPLNYDNSTYYAVVSHNTEFVTSKWVDMGEASFPYFGSTGLLMGGILILTLGLISISSGGWTIVFLLVGVLASMATKLLDMDYYLYVYIVCAGALIIWKLATRRTI